MKIEFSFQHGRRDVTCKPAIACITEEMGPRKNWVRRSPSCVSIAHPILSQATSKPILHRLDTECQNPRRVVLLSNHMTPKHLEF